jgi:hypothetical protein
MLMSADVRSRWSRTAYFVAAVTAAAGGCIKSPETALERLMESRRSTADLQVQFTKAADASNRAVMADTDDASAAFAREADQATQTVQKNIDALGPLLRDLQYSDEGRLLDEFKSCFEKYRQLDRTILDLAVANTNLKAQRLSFGPAREAAEAFRVAVEAVGQADPKETWRVRAAAESAVAELRQIEVLEAPHIAESSDAAMTELEQQMAASEQRARAALKTLSGLAAPVSRQSLADASTALDRFMSLHAHIIELSRRNTNVRSLALALGQKRTVTASCESTLQALQEGLGKRGVAATR